MEKRGYIPEWFGEASYPDWCVVDYDITEIEISLTDRDFDKIHYISINQTEK